MRPDRIEGHWIRTWIKAPGFEDHTTRVHWMQCGLAYADVRIPAERPDLSGAACLADLDAAALLQLARAEGFAGQVTLTGARCTWHRDINWHGQPDGQDIGDLRFDSAGRMIETGVEADYAELWEHRTSPAKRAQVYCAGGVEAHLVSIGNAFVLGIGTPGAATTKPLIAALETGSKPADLPRLFDGFHAFGHFDGSRGIADLATNPFAEGLPVVTLAPDGVIWHRMGFDGSARDVTLPSQPAAADRPASRPKTAPEVRPDPPG